MTIFMCVCVCVKVKGADAVALEAAIIQHMGSPEDEGETGGFHIPGQVLL